MVRQNIIANLGGRAWGFISVYLFIPLYLKFLGIEAYGLVAFYSTLLGVLAFADMGFTATLNREMARLSVRKDAVKEMGDSLRTFELAYGLITLLLSILIWFLAPLIAERWLHSAVLRPSEITLAIRLMGISIGFQMPSGLYIGGLMGLQKQILANSLQVIWSIFRGLGAVLVLWLYSPTIIAFAAWQLISTAVYCITARWCLWRTLASPELKPRFMWRVFRNTWRYAAGMAGMAGLSAILMQADKIVVSKMLSLEVFGYYTIAGVLATAPVFLASPIAAAVFPHFTGLVALGDQEGLKKIYHESSELVAVAIIPAGLTLMLLSRSLIYAWTGSTQASDLAGGVAVFLLAGQLIQAILIIPYYLALANGYTRLNICFGIVSVVMVTPFLIVLTRRYGVVGAGISWLTLNLFTLLPYIYFLHRRFLVGELRPWFLRSIGRPTIVALPCVLLGWWLVQSTSSRILAAFQALLIWAVSVGMTAISVPNLRVAMVNQTRRLLGTLRAK